MIKDNIDIIMISETKLIRLFLKVSVNFVATLNQLDLTEMKAAVEFLYLSVTIYHQT